MILLFLPKRSKGGKSSGLVSPTKSRKDDIINGGLGYPSPTTLSHSELGSQQRGSGVSSPRSPPLSSHPGRKPVLGQGEGPRGSSGPDARHHHSHLYGNVSWVQGTGVGLNHQKPLCCGSIEALCQTVSVRMLQVFCRGSHSYKTRILHTGFSLAHGSELV